MNVLQTMKKILQPSDIIEKGYRPKGKVDTTKPPKGGSGIPPKSDTATQKSKQK